MNITPIKTEKVTAGKGTLFSLLDAALSDMPEKSILSVTSKIISLTEGSVVPMETTDKKALIEQEAQLFIPPEKSKYDISLTITRDTLIPTAGIDESNGNGNYVLWPRDPEKSARDILDYLTRRCHRN
ncbi:MAG: hypothetical protein HKUEN02_22560 [Anaerolineaceae bacterium]|nr:MAG: hypothetical protein HKUEN02_22560 [Anaerolineaceae bacterium]